MTDKINWLPKPAVLAKLGLKTTKLYALINHEGFPPPVKVGRASLWPEHEIEAWMAERAARPRQAAA